MLNIVIPYKWTKSMNHVKNLIIIISQKKFDGANNNYVIN